MKKLIAFITLQSWRQTRRRQRYDELKALIVKEHLAGRGGIVVPRKFGKKDLQSFGPPMYFPALGKTPRGLRPCIFWRKDLMDREVGKPTEEVLNQRKAEIAQVTARINEQIEEQAREISDQDGLPARNGVAVELSRAGKGNA